MPLLTVTHPDRSSSGWHLGERNMWEKKGLDELDCRVPLLIRAPWIDAAKGRTSALAEQVDMM